MIAIITIFLMVIPIAHGCFQVISIPSHQDEVTNHPNTTTTTPTITAASHLIVNDDEAVCSLMVDVPGVNLKDLTVDVEYETRDITVRGLRIVTTNRSIIYQGAWRMAEGPNIYDLTMEHQNGVVMMSVPKKTKHQEHSKIRRRENGLVDRVPAVAPLPHLMPENDDSTSSPMISAPRLHVS